MTSRTPDLTIYVRHSKGCKYAAVQFSRRCTCRKSLTWSHEGKRHRISAGTRSWSEAEAVKDGIKAQLSGAMQETINTAKGSRDAIALFIEHKRVEGVSADVLAKYTRELYRLASYAELKGVYTVGGMNREL